MRKKKGMVAKMNAWVAERLSDILSSMWLFWLLSIVLIIIGIAYPATDPYTFVMFWISAVFQAIALPVLAFVSNIQGEKQGKITRATHENVLEELRLIKQQLAMLQEQKEHLTDISGDTDRIEKKIYSQEADEL
ncbi:hypothetical protein FWH09_02240 [Candidatus Saccharibacteria bacterium]|nr:hypothetical protein [Candidatus Saccharibacteria bacterium]